MKKIIRLLSLILALFCLTAAVASCNKKEADEDTDTEIEYGSCPEYDGEKLSLYIRPFGYIGLTVAAQTGESSQEALWRYIVDSAVVIEYPEENVEYYVSQERAKYKYFAKRDGIEYEELLAALDVTEESIYENARALVKEDLVLLYIINDADVTLTDEEKALHTDKYAEKLVEVYGHDAEYIKQNMTEQIYEAMLSDKTMEYLLSKNTVLGQKDTQK